MTKLINLVLLVFFVLLTACRTGYPIQNFIYPEPVNTDSKKIELQSKKLYDLGGVYVDNRFDQARMNFVSKLNDTLIEIIIKPENTPVNNSPWYAFKIWSDKKQSQWLKLNYVKAYHRYWPKVSYDGKHWQSLDSSAVHFTSDNKSVLLFTGLDTLPLWIAAQPVIDSHRVMKWIDSLTNNNSYCFDYQPIGKSVLNRDIPFFKIGTRSGGDKKVILLFSRQHPPEITGFKALQFFIEALTHRDHLTDKFFQQYEFWVFPLINPDGVDLGHWRHNANGVDLNRDWAYFKQPETKSVRNFIVRQANTSKQKVILGIDFHSTFRDIYYVNELTNYDIVKGFPENWTLSIDKLVAPFYTVYDDSPIKKPVSKAWFYYQFGAAGITYEVGDNTPENIIKQKAKAAVVSLIDLLIR